jgi:hypothetical protein
MYLLVRTFKYESAIRFPLLIYLLGLQLIFNQLEHMYFSHYQLCFIILQTFNLYWYIKSVT